MKKLIIYKYFYNRNINYLYYYNLYLMKSFGYHLILDCKKCNKSKIKNLDNIRNFIYELLKLTKMKKWGELVVQDLQSGPKHLHGYSVIQLIHTSSIVCHFCNESGDIYVDFFSCKSFDNDTVINCVNKYFNPKKIKSQFIERNTNF